jgi:hypothetical protein
MFTCIYKLFGENPDDPLVCAPLLRECEGRRLAHLRIVEQRRQDVG